MNSFSEFHFSPLGTPKTFRGNKVKTSVEDLSDTDSIVSVLTRDIKHIAKSVTNKMKSRTESQSDMSDGEAIFLTQSFEKKKSPKKKRSKRRKIESPMEAHMNSEDDLFLSQSRNRTASPVRVNMQKITPNHPSTKTPQSCKKSGREYDSLDVTTDTDSDTDRSPPPAVRSTKSHRNETRVLSPDTGVMSGHKSNSTDAKVGRKSRNVSLKLKARLPAAEDNHTDLAADHKKRVTPDRETVSAVPAHQDSDDSDTSSVIPTNYSTCKLGKHSRRKQILSHTSDIEKGSSHSGSNSGDSDANSTHSDANSSHSETNSTHSVAVSSHSVTNSSDSGTNSSDGDTNSSHSGSKSSDSGTNSSHSGSNSSHSGSNSSDSGTNSSHSEKKNTSSRERESSGSKKELSNNNIDDTVRLNPSPRKKLKHKPDDSKELRQTKITDHCAVTPECSSHKTAIKKHQPLRYLVPSGFELTSDLTSQYISQTEVRGTQLWLIKAPISFDISSLDGEQLPLTGGQGIICSNKSHNKFEVTATPSQESRCNSVVPDNSDSLVIGPAIAGHLQVTGCIPAVAPVHLEQTRPGKHCIPRNLKPTYKPFGSVSPIRYNDKARDYVEGKQHNHDDHGSRRQKKKRKKEKKKRKRENDGHV